MASENGYQNISYTSTTSSYCQLPVEVTQKEITNNAQSDKENEKQDRKRASGVGQSVGGVGRREEEGEGNNGGEAMAGGGEGQTRREGLVTDFDEEPKMKTGAYQALLHSTSNKMGPTLLYSLKTQPHFD